MISFTERTSTLQVVVLLSFIGKGICDSICPNGITNMTGSTTGTLVYPSSGTYGINETKCWKIEIPKPYAGVGIFFQSYEVEECSSCRCDRLNYATSYILLPFSNPKCERITSRYWQHLRTVTGSTPDVNGNGANIWFRFVSDATVNNKGFNLYYIARSASAGFSQTSVLNASEGETFEFGTPKVTENKNYPASFEWDWFLIVPGGRQVQLTFDSFDLEQSTNCENDYLEVREALFENTRFFRDIDGTIGPILLKPQCGTNKPSTIQSAGNMVWVHFKSDSNSTTTYKGFKASFKAGQGRLSINHPMTLLLFSALLVVTSAKNSLF